MALLCLYWKVFFEDHFGIACGYKGERRHQLLVPIVGKGRRHSCLPKANVRHGKEFCQKIHHRAKGERKAGMAGQAAEPRGKTAGNYGRQYAIIGSYFRPKPYFFSFFMMVLFPFGTRDGAGQDILPGQIECLPTRAVTLFFFWFYIISGQKRTYQQEEDTGNGATRTMEIVGRRYTENSPVGRCIYYQKRFGGRKGI